MRTSIIFNKSLSSLVDGLLKQLRLQGFSEKTLKNYTRRLRPIQNYMKDNNITIYTPVVGQDYLKYYLSKNQAIKSREGLISSIRRLNDYYYGNPFRIQHVAPGKDHIPDCFSSICEDYLLNCIKNGNVNKTIARKRRALARFFSKCVSLGSISLETITPQIIIIATSDVSNIDEWSDIRLFFKFCCEQELIDADFSTFVPKGRRIVKIPDTYSVDELILLENAIDRSTIMGKRDYAMVLLADRLGIRSGDIVSLKYRNLNFRYREIRFKQQKTGVEISLPMPDDVLNALNSYISTQNPMNDSEFVFRKTHAPFDALTNTSVYNTVSKYLKLGNINTTGKRTGPHTLRASLSTSMINDDIPYSAVQSALGHTSRNAIKHYAKTDINKLRRCAVSVPMPSGNFNLFLEGEKL